MPIAVSGDQVASILERLGFHYVSQRSSHRKYRKVEGDRVLTVIVPMHVPLAPGTLSSVLRQANLTSAQFCELLHARSFAVQKRGQPEGVGGDC